jgi:hypothetical protein
VLKNRLKVGIRSTLVPIVEIQGVSEEGNLSVLYRRAGFPNLPDDGSGGNRAGNQGDSLMPGDEQKEDVGEDRYNRNESPGAGLVT